jgi:drug/metabolite transporter (DMT)-like permease
MNGSALGLVLAAAFAHALWNFYAKRIGSASLALIWMSGSLGVVVYAPPAVWELLKAEPFLGVEMAVFLIGNILLHTAYFLLLQHGYVAGDLSVVYPIARGTGPVLAIAGGVILLGERPSIQALAGGLVVCAGVAGLGFVGWSGRHARSLNDRRSRRAALVYAALTGVAIASYTVWDARAVNSITISPLLFSWMGMLVRCLMLMPLAWWHRARVRTLWREHRLPITAVAVLSPLAYLLVLVAFTLAPVSYVAPARELSILIGAALGTKLLGEGQGRVRLGSAATILAGILLLATA